MIAVVVVGVLSMHNMTEFEALAYAKQATKQTLVSKDSHALDLPF